jgi:spermidine/putrescine ABC transporter ATP-binding subunit
MKPIDVFLKDVTVRYGDIIAVSDLTLEVLKGEFLALLGPSGCGKTTTLRMIAGLVHPDEGEIYISDRNVNDIPIEKRNIGMVFQNYALWPHLNVFENVAFGLEMAKVNKVEVHDRVRKALSLLKLTGFEKRYSHELSGGQQQRVALARAIVINPTVLLLDEPLGALDKKLREEMQIELKQLQRKLGITTIFVTHDQEEALSLADRIAVMDQGVFQQLGTPDEVYEKPQNKFVANFIGLTNFLTGKLIRQDENTATCEIGQGTLVCIYGRVKGQKVSEVEVAIRPERMQMFRSEEMRAMVHKNVIQGTVANKVYTGTIVNYYVTLKDGGKVVVTLQNLGDAKNSFQLGDQVAICWCPEDCLLFERSV